MFLTRLLSFLFLLMTAAAFLVDFVATMSKSDFTPFIEKGHILIAFGLVIVTLWLQEIYDKK